MAIANIKVKLTPDGSAIDAELSKIAKKTPSIVNPELKKQAQQVIEIGKDVAKEQQRLNDLKVKQAQQANAQILKDEERVSKERQRILREDIIARQKAEQQAQKIKADAEKFLQRLHEQEVKDKALNQKRLDALKQFEADRLRITKTASKDLEAEVQRNVLAIQRARILGDAEEIKRLHAQNALIRSEMIKRPDVKTQGAGVGAGILGVGRNIITQTGSPIGSVLSAGGGTAAAVAGGVLAVKVFKDMADEGEKLAQIQDNLAAGFRRTGLQGVKLAEAVKLASDNAKVLGDTYVIDDDIISEATAAYLRYGGTSDNIAKKQQAIIGLAERLGISYEEAGEKLAKITSEDVQLELKGTGIIIGDVTDENERLNIILGKVQGNLKGLGDKAETNLGQFKQGKLAIDNAKESFQSLAFTMISALSPALKAVAKIMEFVADNGKILVTVILSIVAPVTLLAKVIYDNFGKIKGYVSDAIDGIVSVYQAAERTLNKVTGGLLGKSAEEQQVAKDREASNNKLAESTKKINSAVNDNTQVIANNKAVLAEWNKTHKDTYVDLEKNKSQAQKTSYASESVELQKHLNFMLSLAGDDKQKQIALYDEYYNSLLNLAIKFYKKDEALAVQATIDKRNRVISIVTPRSESEQQKGTLALPQKSNATNEPELPFWLQSENSDLESIKGYLTSVTDAFENYLFTPLNNMLSGLGGLFGTLFNAIFQQIEQVAAKLLSSGIINAILNLFGGGIAGGFLGGIGNFLAGLFGGGKAGGGTLQKGKFYITGEHAPEIIDYTGGTPNVIPLSSGGQYQLASRFRNVGGQNPQSLRIGGFISAFDRGRGNQFSSGAFANPFLNVGGQDPMSLRIGGFISIIMKQQSDFLAAAGEMMRRIDTPRIMPVVVNSHNVTSSQNQSNSVRAVSYLGG